MVKQERVDPPRAAATPPAGGDTANSASSSFSTDSTARPEAARRMTLDSFRELFRERPVKRFGPVWHGWQFFLACLPALTIAVVCNYFKEQILRDRLAASTSAETSASATCATAADMQVAPPASASPQFNATKASSAPSRHAENEDAIAGAGKGALDGATPQLMQQRIRELEDRLRKVEDARAIGLDQVRLSLPLSGLMEGVSGDFQLPVPGLFGASTPAPQRSAAVTCEEASASSRSLPPAAAVSGPWWGRLVSRFKGMKSLGSGSGGDDK